MQDTFAAVAVRCVLENRLLDLERLVARQPEALAGVWGDVLMALGATDGIETEKLLEALLPLLRGAGPRRSLNDAVDADANRAVHWTAFYGQAAKLDAFKSYGADLRLPNRLGTTPLFDAVRGACAAAIETVLRHEGAEVLDHLNEYDCTAMHWACKHASLPGAIALHSLNSGLLNRPNRRGGLPLDVLEWRELYQADLAWRSLGRAATDEELAPYRELHTWMTANGARRSRGWAALPNGQRLRRGSEPFNAELWCTYVRPPSSWLR
jgi:ankyrin repeat protein